MSMFGLARSKAFWQQQWTELRIILNTCFSDDKGTVDCISCSSHALTHLTSLISRIGNFEAMKVDMSVKSNVIHVHDYAVKKHFTTTAQKKQDFIDTCQLNTCSFMQTDVTVLLRTTQISQKRTLEMTFWSAEQSTAPWYAAVSWSTSLHSSGYTTASDLSCPWVASSSAARSASVKTQLQTLSHLQSNSNTAIQNLDHKRQQHNYKLHMFLARLTSSII